MCRPNLMVYALPLTPNLAIPQFHALCCAVCVWRYTRANLVRTATNRPKMLANEEYMTTRTKKTKTSLRRWRFITFPRWKIFSNLFCRSINGVRERKRASSCACVCVCVHSFGCVRASFSFFGIFFLLFVFEIARKIIIIIDGGVWHCVLVIGGDGSSNSSSSITIHFGIC